MAPRLLVERLEDRWCPSGYTITDLGSFGATTPVQSYAYAINKAGQVAGRAYTASGDPHAFLFSNNVKIDLGTLPGFVTSGAGALNDSAQVVGGASAADGIEHAFLWQDLNNNGLSDPGEMIDLAPPANTYSVAWGVNNAVSGVHTVQVVGDASGAWLWQDGVMTDVNTLPPIKNSGWFLNEALGINDNQQIVGRGTINGQTHGYVLQWQVGGSVPTDLGLWPGGTYSGAHAINQTGQVVGIAETATAQGHAFLRTSAVLTDLGTLSKATRSDASALNNASAGDSVQVVGYSLAGSLNPRAVLWQNGKITDLTKQLPANSGWSLEWAKGVNDAGQIVGYGQLSSAGGRRGFLLTPIPGGKNLMAAALPARAVQQTLSVSQVTPLLAEAVARWQAAGVDTSGLGNIQIQISNLGGATLGLADETHRTITLDDNAAGWGWFIDPTPHNDSEFTTPGNQGEQHRMDLLTVLEHEIGHLLGKEHEASGVMQETLAAGTRLTPSAGPPKADADWLIAIDGLFAEAWSKKRM